LTVYYKDISLTLDKAQDGDIADDININAVKNSINNISATLQGGRVMVSEFANNAYALLFEPLSNDIGTKLANSIWDSIEYWDNRVAIENINVNVNYDLSQYEMDVTFSINSITKEPEQITVLLKQQ